MKATLDDPKFKPHEFSNVIDLFKARCGWVPPSERKHLKELLPGETMKNVLFQKTA